MGKKFFGLMMAVMIVVAAVGCSNGSSSDSIDNEKTSDSGTKESVDDSSAKDNKEDKSTSDKENTVIQMWTEDRHDSDYVEKKIAEFNEKNTFGITIELTVVADNYFNMLSMAYSAGNAPDIAGVSAASGGYDLKLLSDAQIISPLTEYIKDPEYEKVTQASEIAYEGINTMNGEIYWVPTGMRSGVRIIYNKDLLSAAGYSEFPTTLDEVVELADKVTQMGNGEYYGVGFTSSSPFERWLEGVAEISGVYRYDYVNGKFDFEGYRPILEKAQELFNNNSVLPGSMEQGVDAMRAQFADGKFAIWGNASQEAGVFTEQFPISDFEWGVAEIPTLNNEVVGSETINPQKGYMMINSSEHKDLAWEVIKYFSSEEFLTGYLEGGYSLPITSYMDEKIDKSKIGRLADFKLTDYENVYPAVPSITLEGDPYRVIFMYTMMGAMSIDDAIADLNERYNMALDNDVQSGKIKRLVIKDFDPLHPNAGTIEYLSE